ncbi:MAG: HAD-IC family P-type ATPase [Bacteroidetes bacterium]|nr:HAD-IC family P-type ATPase [Bacteroidota bacterium]
MRLFIGANSSPIKQVVKSYLEKSKSLEVKNYKEETGNGISGVINGQPLKLGSAAWLQLNNLSEGKNQTKVHVSFNNVYAGYFSFENSYRTGIDVLAKLCKTNHIKTAVLSGDNNSEKDNLKEIFGKETELRFNQSPADKLGFVKILQEKNLKVMMVGDGLNDAGALQQSNVGIAVADNTNNFTPAADVIIDAAQLKNIFNLVLYAKAAYHIIVWSLLFHCCTIL